MTSHRLRPILFAMIAGTAAMFQLVGWGHDRDEPLAIRRLILVESREVNRNIVEEVYRAVLAHTAPPGSRDFASVNARIVHPFGLPFPGVFQIIDGDLEFGTVRVGQGVESRDTFTIRRFRHHPLKSQDLRWAITGRPDLVLSDAWAGEWRLTITAKDSDTGSLDGVDVITSSLGAGEPVGLSLLPDSVQCLWSGTDQILEANCRARFRFARCRADGSTHVTVERDDSSLTGQGQWSVTATGDCGPNSGSGGQSIEIAGVRLNQEAEPEPFSPGVLARLATTPALMGLVADRLGDDAAGPPTSDVDCSRGRWRRLTNPAFRNAQACRAFVERHHSRRDEGGR